MPTYARADLAFERGEGPYLYTAEGRRYLDFGSGIAVTALGHAHPHLIEALTAGYLSSAYKDAAAFIVILVVLFAMPSGLFGPRHAERV